MAVSSPRTAKERARFPADFAVTAKEPQWQCVLKSTPSLKLLIVPLDVPHAFEQHLAMYLRRIGDLAVASCRLLSTINMYKNDTAKDDAQLKNARASRPISL